MEEVDVMPHELAHFIMNKAHGTCTPSRLRDILFPSDSVHTRP